MSLSAALGRMRGGDSPDITKFVKSIDPEWIDEALQATGAATVRTRRLPAEKVLWLIIGMALFTDRSIKNVAQHLQLAINGKSSMASSALTQARQRLTSAPLQWLFQKIASVWGACSESKWRGLSLYGVDGSHQRVDDSIANHEHFGRPKGRATSGYPQMRYVALMNLTTRMLKSVAVGAWRVGEVTLAKILWPQIPDHSLTIVDRGFLSYAIFFQILAGKTNRHFLCRAKSNTRYEIVHVLDDGSALIQLELSVALRKEHPEAPKRLTVRAIAYQHPGGKAGLLFTSLHNYELYPADEIVALYHKRWELELAFDEIKTHMLHRREALRSKTVDGVYQEFWGIMLVYNLVRREMVMVATAEKVSPAHISFTGSLLLIQNFFLASPMAAPGTLPKYLAKMEGGVADLVLAKRRSDRRNPRQVKIKMSQYLKAPPRHPSEAA